MATRFSPTDTGIDPVSQVFTALTRPRRRPASPEQVQALSGATRQAVDHRGVALAPSVSRVPKADPRRAARGQTPATAGLNRLGLAPATFLISRRSAVAS